MRSISSMNDATLIDAHLRGDSRALGELMNRHRDSLMGFLVNRVGTEAEDLHQEVWTRVSSGLPTYNEQGTFRAWMFQIARRLITDHHRRKSARIRLVLPDDEPMPSGIDAVGPDAILRARQMSAAFDKAMAAMNPETAEVVHLRLTKQVPFKEIAERQGVPLNTALGRMHNGLNTVRASLEAAGLLEKRRKP